MTHHYLRDIIAVVTDVTASAEPTNVLICCQPFAVHQRPHATVVQAVRLQHA